MEGSVFISWNNGVNVFLHKNVIIFYYSTNFQFSFSMVSAMARIIWVKEGDKPVVAASAAHYWRVKTRPTKRRMSPIKTRW
jgi:hypothetical protein